MALAPCCTKKPSLAAQLTAQGTRPASAKRDSGGGRRRPLAFGVQGQPSASDRPRQQRFSPLRLFHCLRCHRALRRAPPHRHCPQRQWGLETAIPAAWPHPSMTRSRCSSRWVGGAGLVRAPDPIRLPMATGTGTIGLRGCRRLIRCPGGLPAAAAAAAAPATPCCRCLCRPCCPLSHFFLMQLAHLDAAGYQAWLMRTSRGQARFFHSSRLEAVTKVKWCAEAGRCCTGHQRRRA